MKTNKHYERLRTILSVINERGISSTSELQKPCHNKIYAELWFAVQGFINYCALCSKTHFNSERKQVHGNSEKIRALRSSGFEVEDIQGDILVHVFSKMDMILKQPFEKQINYTYRIINNCIYDQFRKLPPIGMSVVSLNDKIKGKNISPEDACEIQDLVADYNTPEDQTIAWETVNEIYEAKRASIFNEIALLYQKPSEVFVQLCSKHLNMKPAAITKLLLDKGVTESFTIVLIAVANEFSIPLNSLRNALKNKVVSEESLKLDTKDESKVSAQVSRLIYRAGKRLKP